MISPEGAFLTGLKKNQVKNTDISKSSNIKTYFYSSSHICICMHAVCIYSNGMYVCIYKTERQRQTKINEDFFPLKLFY